MTSTIRAPKAKGPQTGVMFIRGMNRDLKDHFRSECVKRGMPMRQVIEEFMRLYVETAGKVPGEKTVREANNRVKARQ